MLHTWVDQPARVVEFDLGLLGFERAVVPVVVLTE